MRWAMACASAALRRPFSASLPSAAAIDSLPLRAAPGCASKSSVRAPHWASTCAMPRPMVPAPATPVQRSLRRLSSMEPDILAGAGGYNPPRGGRGMKQVVIGLAAAVLAALLASASDALAQPYPSRTITLICPWPAGGGTDLHLRRISEIASKGLGQPIVVE